MVFARNILILRGSRADFLKFRPFLILLTFNHHNFGLNGGNVIFFGPITKPARWRFQGGVKNFHFVLFWTRSGPKREATVKSFRWGLWNLGQRLQSQKNKFTFFSQNLFSIPRDIPWHHWKNLLTSKRGRSGGFNFFTKSGQIWLKTSGGSRDLNFNPICKCHTISESSWCPYEALPKLIDLRGH